ncbi:hypothetical protein [Arthrobacter sp. OAP107]|uniref:hypothetical protein n=1 Tax=Arthrobacter sp. OAP107 TaxID=3156445 RepID=UPI003390C550
MNHGFSFTRLVDSMEQLSHELPRAVTSAKAIVGEVREIYCLVSPLLERFNAK